MIKVLVIEDEESVRKTISDLLEVKGYDVLSTSGGKEGVKLAKELIPDLILCDIMMPDYDGYKVLKKLLSYSPLTIDFRSTLLLTEYCFWITVNFPTIMVTTSLPQIDFRNAGC